MLGLRYKGPLRDDTSKEETPPANAPAPTMQESNEHEENSMNQNQLLPFKNWDRFNELALDAAKSNISQKHLSAKDNADFVRFMMQIYQI